MKVTTKLLAILLGLTLVFSMGISMGAAAAETASTNLLKNPSFEDGLTGWTAKRGNSWSLSNLAASNVYSYNTSSALSTPTGLGEGFGEKYVHFPTNSTNSLLLQKVTGLKSGTKYQFSGWAYCQHTDSAANKYVNIIYSYYKGDTLLNDLTRNSSGYESDVTVGVRTVASSWVLVRTTFELPEGADGVEIGIKTTYRSQSLRRYDNFSLVEYTNLIVDGDFENMTASGDAANWNETAGGYVGSNDAHTGQYAFGGSSEQSYVQQYVNISPSTRYKLTYWTKATADVTEDKTVEQSRPRLRVYFYTEEATSKTSSPGSNVGRLTFDNASQRDGSGWCKVEVYFTSEEDSNSLGLTLYATTYNNLSTTQITAAYLIDDVKLEEVTDDAQLQKFSETAPLKHNRFEADDAYTAVENAVNTSWTIKPVTTVTNDTTIYASAYAPKTANAMLMYGLYSTDESGNRVLKSVKLASPDANGMLSASMDVPAEGTYTLEAFALENLAELSPTADKIILQ